MDRKKFFQDVRNFKDFKHPRVSELSVDEELISFTYASLEGKAVNVSIDLHASPNVTSVFLGEKDITYKKKYLPDVISSIFTELGDKMDSSSPVSTTPADQSKAAKVQATPAVLTPAPAENKTEQKAPTPKLDSLNDFEQPESTGDVGRSSSSTELRVSGSAVDVDDFTFGTSMGPENGVEIVDSRGRKLHVCKELKNDIDSFKRVFGNGAIDITAYGDDMTILLDLGVDRVIEGGTMLAWGFNREKKVYARIKTSVYYRDNAFQKVHVQEGITAEDGKFTPQFQLENIINNYMSATWAHGSKPFENPLLQEVEDETGLFIQSDKKKSRTSKHSKSASTKKGQKRERESGSSKRITVSNSLRELVTMGFDIGIATKALSMCDDDVARAVAICCEEGDTLVTTDLDQDKLRRQLALILSGRDEEEPVHQKDQEYVDIESVCGTSSSSDKTEFNENYLVELIRYVQSRIPTLNDFCIICDKKHVFGHMLKPTVCTRDLCCWSFQELGVGSGATDFVATSFEIVDMLLQFAQYAIRSSRREAIFNPYPLIFDPKDQKKKIFDPDKRDYAKVERILTRIPTTKSMITKGLKMSDELEKIDPHAHQLLSWIIASNRSFFVKLPPEIEIKAIKAEQFLMLSSPPERERVFRSLRKKYGSVYAFHGSPCENWHSIVRNGLKNASGTSLMIHGAACGSGIYMSPFLGTASGYAHVDSSGLSVVAVVEVINHGINKASSDIWTVADERNVTTRMLLLIRNGCGFSATGESIAPQIRSVMAKYGVSED